MDTNEFDPLEACFVAGSYRVSPPPTPWHEVAVGCGMLSHEDPVETAYKMGEVEWAYWEMEWLARGRCKNIRGGRRVRHVKVSREVLLDGIEAQCAEGIVPTAKTLGEREGVSHYCARMSLGAHGLLSRFDEPGEDEVAAVDRGYMECLRRVSQRLIDVVRDENTKLFPPLSRIREECGPNGTYLERICEYFGFCPSDLVVAVTGKVTGRMGKAGVKWDRVEWLRGELQLGDLPIEVPPTVKINRGVMPRFR